jgi:hypothetical protein
MLVKLTPARTFPAFSSIHFFPSSFIHKPLRDSVLEKKVSLTFCGRYIKKKEIEEGGGERILLSFKQTDVLWPFSRLYENIR